tara:strand:+ start:423 stop:563 length:141 start_codon:yes stop_codon:yes gene_type:complete
MTIEDTLKEIDMIGELLEKKMGKKRFEAAIKKVNEDYEKEREDNSQ